MVNSFTSGKLRLVTPSYGSYPNQWNQPVNSDWGMIDAGISGTTTLNTSSLTPSTPFWTLVFQDFDTNATPWQNPLAGQNLRILVQGALTYNAVIFIPQNFPGMWIIDNQTTGAFTVSVKTTNSSSVGVSIPQGYMSFVFCDGTNVKWADQGNTVANQAQGVPSGTILSFGGGSPPAGYLFCDGIAISRTTFSSLFSAIGTAWGVGDGTTTFNLPDLQNQFLRGAGASPVGSSELDTLGSHTHTATVTDPGHTHQTALVSSSTTGYGIGTSVSGIQGAIFGTSSSTLTDSKPTGVTVANASTGGTETRPVNKRVLYIIKT